MIWIRLDQAYMIREWVDLWQIYEKRIKEKLSLL